LGGRPEQVGAEPLASQGHHSPIDTPECRSILDRWLFQGAERNVAEGEGFEPSRGESRAPA